MATKPAKLIQVGAPLVANDSLTPVISESDRRMRGVTGSTGTFVSGGVQGAGLPFTVIADPGVAAITLTPDQVVGAMLTFGPIAAADLQVNFPTAAEIVSYIGSDICRVRPGASPTNGAPIPAVPNTVGPQIFQAFDLFINVFDTNSTYTFGAANALNSSTKTFMYGGGFTQNAGALGVAINTLSFLHFKVIIANSTPGAELVWIVPVGK